MFRFIAVGLLLPWATVSAASETAVRNCRAITDNAQRLACYDSIALPSAPNGAGNGSGATGSSRPTGSAAAPAAPATVPPSARGATTGNSAQGATPASAGTSASRTAGVSAVPAAPTASDRAEFGLPPRPTAANVDRIESRIKGRLVNWQQGTRIRLENGQVWQVTDDSRGWCECDNPRVIVSRGAFGTYFLEIEGKGNAPRVRRIE